MLKFFSEHIENFDPYRAQKELQKPHVRGDSLQIMAFPPHQDIPHPSRAFGKQQTGLFQIPAHTAKVEDQGVLDLAAGSGFQRFRLGLHPSKRMFHSRSNPAKFTVSFYLTLTQRVAPIRFILNSIKPSKLPRHLLHAIIGVAFIPKQRFRFQIRQLLGIPAVVMIGRAEDAFVDQLAFRIQSNMSFVAKIGSIAFLGRAGIAVVLRILLNRLRLLFALIDRSVGRFDHRGIDDAALADKQAFFIELDGLPLRTNDRSGRLWPAHP